MCIGKNTENEAYLFNKTEMKNSTEEKILGITLTINVKSHVKNLCKKASQKIWAWSRLTNYLNDSAKKTQCNNQIPVQLLFISIDVLF